MNQIHIRIPGKWYMTVIMYQEGLQVGPGGERE